MAPSKPFIIFIIGLAILAFISVFALPHVIDGDAVTYVDAIKVLNGAPLDSSIGMHDYVVHRIMTTFVGLEVINLLTFVVGNVEGAWLIWDTLIFFLINILFFKLLLKMFKSDKTAVIGGLFFAANYAMVIFGLTFFMDIGGWFFYILSIYYLYSYTETVNKRDLWTAALALSVGGFFKENAMFAYVPLFIVVFYEHRRSMISFLGQIIPLSLVAFVPMLVHYVLVFLTFNENYFHWIQINRNVYVYPSRLIEYIKSFGSLLNFLAPAALVGAIVFIRELFGGSPVESQKKRGKLSLLLTDHPFLNNKKVVFIVSVLLSSLPAVMWPGITQRVLFMVVPGLVILACFLIRRTEKYWYLWVIVLVFYAATSLLMDSFVLNFVNLPF